MSKEISMAHKRAKGKNRLEMVHGLNDKMILKPWNRSELMGLRMMQN